MNRSAVPKTPDVRIEKHEPQPISSKSRDLRSEHSDKKMKVRKKRGAKEQDYYRSRQDHALRKIRHESPRRKECLN